MGEYNELFSKSIGEKVKNKSGKEGEIISFDGNYIQVQYEDGVKTLVEKSFTQGCVIFLNEEFQKKIKITPPAPPRPNTDKLISGKLCGTVAQKIYDNCCEKFGWNENLRGQFAQQKKLYAVNATKEYYNVWFLCHSNWTGTLGGMWYNEISFNQNTIIEHWESTIDGFWDNDGKKRVTFVKDSKGQYVFLGLYVFESIDAKSKTKTYRRVSDCYPD